MSTLKVGGIRGVSASSDAITVANDGTCTANVTNNLSNRNKVGNGAMLCAQRGTSHSPGASSQIYTLDRFQHIATTGVAFDATVTQDSSAPVGFSKSYKVTPDATDTPTGGGNGCIRTKIEGQDLQDLAYGGSDAKKVTVSFYAKSAGSNNNQQYTFQLRHFATDGTQRSINAPFTITSSFQRFIFSFIGDTAVGGSSPVSFGYQLYIAQIPPNTVSQLRMDEYANQGYNVTGRQVGGHNRYSGTTNHQLNFSGTRRLWWRYVRSGNDRSFVFTNNLAISCVLSGADPFDGVTVNAGATATSTATNSTDGSFNITMTISGSDGSSQPFALAVVNSGTGSLDTSGYSGTFSASAL